MTQTAYQRVDAAALEGQAYAGPPPAGQRLPTGVRWFVLPLSVLLCIAQAVVTVGANNTQAIQITATLIAVLAMGALFLAVLILNPLLRLIYLGDRLPTPAAAACQRLMGWSGRVTLALTLALPAAAGPRFMLAALALVLGATLAVALGDGLLGLTRKRGLSPTGRSMLRWSLLLPGAYAVCLASAHLPLVVRVAGLSLSPAVALLLAAAALYAALWIFFSRGLNRAELLTISAALIVTSGISVFGLCEQLVPLIPTPNNPGFNTPATGWNDQLIPHMRKGLYIQPTPEGLSAIKDFRAGLQRTLDNQVIVAPDEKQGLAAWAGYYWTVARNLPWGQWVGPLGFWMIFVLGCYALFYALTYTVLGHWSQREKLIFPLAKLPESLLPEARDTAWFPAMFRTNGFWIGLVLAAGFLSFNALVRIGTFGGMGIIPMGMSAVNFTAAVQGTVFEGVGGGARSMRFDIVFTAVGIAFLLPLEISFSLWFYYLMGRALMLAMVWAGYGRDMRDFPDDWLWTWNAVSAQASGGFVVFSLIVLYRAMKDNFIRVARRTRTTRDRAVALLPVCGLALSFLIVSGWVWWNLYWTHAFWAIIFVLWLMLLTVGIMRIVAEGGVYWFQTNMSFFHFWKALGLGAWFPAVMVAPLLPIYTLLFFDIKTFLPPNLANAGKMQEELPPPGRIKFHLNMVLAILVSIASSIGFAIVMAYARGADRMEHWFYRNGPLFEMETSYRVTTSISKFDPVTTSWMGMGVVWVVLTFVARRTLFWFPHPIGYIMMVNPLMDTMWFSFFIGWVCKKLVVKYGGKSTFDRIKNFFMGMIIGELMAIAGWMVASLVRTMPPTFVSLNR